MNRAVFLVGASGVGKTTIARILEQRAPWTGRTHYFDTIGIPSAEVMEAEYGGAEEWQRWATGQWVDRLAAAEPGPQLIEGQARPSFIREAAEPHPELDVRIVLLDCSTEVRRHRLTELRNQSELANPQMESWAAYLTGQAHALGLPIIDTSHADPDAIAAEVEAQAGIA